MSRSHRSQDSSKVRFKNGGSANVAPEGFRGATGEELREAKALLDKVSSSVERGAQFRNGSRSEAYRAWEKFIEAYVRRDVSDNDGRVERNDVEWTKIVQARLGKQLDGGERLKITGAVDTRTIAAARKALNDKLSKLSGIDTADGEMVCALKEDAVPLMNPYDPLAKSVDDGVAMASVVGNAVGKGAVATERAGGRRPADRQETPKDGSDPAKIAARRGGVQKGSKGEGRGRMFARAATGKTADDGVSPVTNTVQGAQSYTVRGYRGGRPEPVQVVRLSDSYKAHGHPQTEKSPIELTKGTAAAFIKMRAAAKEDGVNLRVVSSFRQHHEQERLRDGYEACVARVATTGAGRCIPAAAEGHSAHQSGRAIDLDVRTQRGAYEWLRDHAASFGFRPPPPFDRGHVEFLGGEPRRELHEPRVQRVNHHPHSRRRRSRPQET